MPYRLLEVTFRENVSYNNRALKDGKVAIASTLFHYLILIGLELNTPCENIINHIKKNKQQPSNNIICKCNFHSKLTIQTTIPLPCILDTHHNMNNIL